MRAKAGNHAGKPCGAAAPRASGACHEPENPLAPPLDPSEGTEAAAVMIGPVRGPEHLALIRREAFYHVPVSAIAAARMGVTHIAFYEPASRFGVPGAIRSYAAVRAVSRVRRSDLPGLTWPGREGPEAMYYRFDLGPLLPLAHPIANPERRRVVFRFVEMERLRTADTLAALGGAARRRRRTRGNP